MPLETMSESLGCSLATMKRQLKQAETGLRERLQGTEQRVPAWLEGEVR